MLKLQKDIIINFVDSAVSYQIVGAGSVFDCVGLLDNSLEFIYDQGSLLFLRLFVSNVFYLFIWNVFLFLNYLK